MPTRPRPGDRILIRAVTDGGTETVWARVDRVDVDSMTAPGGSHGGRYPFRIGFGYEEVRRNGDIVTRAGVVWLDAACHDAGGQVEGYEVVREHPDRHGPTPDSR